MENINKSFNLVTNEAPFIFNNNKDVNQTKKYLKNNIKNGYIWNSYKPKSYKEYCDDKGIILTGSKTKYINKIYREYKTYRIEFYDKYKINESKFNTIQMFNIIYNLLNKKENVKNERFSYEDENYDLGLD